jgi:hypothetical protein
MQIVGMYLIVFIESIPNRNCSDNILVKPDEVILNKIYNIREIKVMLDSDLAGLYGVETKVLKQQVKRNMNRFPDDFMFELTHQEYANLRSQIVTSSFTFI